MNPLYLLILSFCLSINLERYPPFVFDFTENNKESSLSTIISSGVSKTVFSTIKSPSTVSFLIYTFSKRPSIWLTVFGRLPEIKVCAFIHPGLLSH